MASLLLIDGNYFVYRSFHAIRGLKNSRGEPTNAIYGFVRALRKMRFDLKPDFAAIAWDQGLPRRRTDLHPEYKAQRAEMPEEMRPQIAFLRENMPHMGFPSLIQPNTEADDLIATYTQYARKKELDVIIATNDKDLMQLVDPHVSIYSTNKRDITDPKKGFALLSPKEIEEIWSVTPQQIGDVLALMGDSVDNIPGIAGFGQKTATKVLKEFGSLQNLVDQAHSIKSPRLRQAITEGREQVFLNREMVRLDMNLPLPLPLEKLAMKVNYPLLIKALKECEFKKLLSEIIEESYGQADLFS